MSKSGLNDFLLEVIHNESFTSVLAITEKNLSTFANACEDLLKSMSIISLSHLESNGALPNDLCIIFDDMAISKTQIGLIKNSLAQKILVLKKSKDDGDDRLEGGESSDKIFGGLGSDFSIRQAARKR